MVRCHSSHARQPAEHSTAHAPSTAHDLGPVSGRKRVYWFAEALIRTSAYQLPVEKHFFAVEDIHHGIHHLAMHQKRHSKLQGPKGHKNTVGQVSVRGLTSARTHCHHNLSSQSQDCEIEGTVSKNRNQMCVTKAVGGVYAGRGDCVGTSAIALRVSMQLSMFFTPRSELVVAPEVRKPTYDISGRTRLTGTKSLR
eukprot:3712090-Pyramimonas_sp.AAC.1